MVTADNKWDDFDVVHFLKQMIDKYSQDIAHLQVLTSLCDNYFRFSYRYFLSSFMVNLLTNVIPMTYFFAVDDKQNISLYIGLIRYTMGIAIEGVQLKIEGWKYFKDLWNWNDILGMVCYPILVYR